MEYFKHKYQHLDFILQLHYQNSQVLFMNIFMHCITQGEKAVGLQNEMFEVIQKQSIF